MQWLTFNYDINAGTNYRNHTGKPPWLNKINDKSTWHFANNVEYNFNIEELGDGEFNIYTQYGRNDFPTWGSTRFFAQNVKINEKEKLDDNTVVADITITPLFFYGRKTDGSVRGYPVQYTFEVGGQQFDQFSTNTVSNIDKEYNVDPITHEVRIKPESSSTGATIHVTTRYPEGQYDTRTTYAGVGLTNPLSEFIEYVPMSVRKSGNWRALNTDPKGFIRIRKGGTWEDRGLEDEATVMQQDKGHNRIRRSGNWKQLPPMS